MDLFGNVIQDKSDLRAQFGAPPFTILDTKQGDWQAKKRKWINLGIKSEIGREVSTYHTEKYSSQKTNTSVFDPVLCELMYRWYCNVGGSILDPFAGGSVRGIVAQYLGYDYTGIEIREEQVESNLEQSKTILKENNQPTYIIGDSNKVLDEIRGGYDLVFTCPPYADLEVYSKLQGDISNMSYNDFIFAFESIMRKSCRLLKVGGMAIVVVAEVRDKNGNYYGFVADTINLLKRCESMKYYNEAILATPIGTAAFRANGNMIKGNGKLVKTHQNIIMFKKY